MEDQILCHLAGLLLLAVAIADVMDDIYHYPDYCSCFVYKDHDKPVSLNNRLLICEIDILFSYWNFKDIQTNKTLGLAIKCKQQMAGTLHPKGFSQLTQLRELRLHGCLVQNLPEGTLKGLGDLELLVISDDSKNFDSIPPIPKILSPNILIEVPKLEKLDFSYSALVTIPPNLLCPVPKLILWALSYNYLTDIEAIGCGPASTCCQNLLSLNMTKNKLKHITAKALEPMTKMWQLDFSYNLIEEIVAGSLAKMTSLRFMDLKFNRLRTLPQSLFKSNIEIKQINLKNNFISELPNDLFQGLGKLQTLNVADNMISVLPASAFKDLHVLKVLDFSNNHIHAIPEQFFLPMNNIQMMSCAENKIASLENTSMSNLSSMVYLNLSCNNLHDIATDYFANFSKLTVLDISENRIQSPPSFHTLKNLELLNLADNEIHQFENGLVLTENTLELHLQNNCLYKLFPQQLNISSVDVLLLSNCSMTTLSGIYDSCSSLTQLFADHNNINNLRKDVISMHKLKLLNVSYNVISGELDFSITLPRSLEVLDIKHNRLTGLAYRWPPPGFKLKNLDASFNYISFLKFSDFPTALVDINLSNNRIASLGSNTFAYMLSLSTVDLQNNYLTTLSNIWFRFHQPFPQSTRLPMINVNYNFLECDCSNSWLTRRKEVRWYPIIEAGGNCTITQQRMRRFNFHIGFDNITQDQFFCTANEKNHAECVPNCTCYYTTNQNNYQVDCGNYQGKWLFSQFPNKTTHIFLDGVQSAPFHSLHRREAYRFVVALFLNNSHISHIPENAFDSLPNLTELHLENNELVEIPPTALNELHMLQQLYLHENLLKQVNFSMFLSTTNLRKLTLHSNKLRLLHGINGIRSIHEISLANNLLECSCDYFPALQQWILNSDILAYNASNTYCSDTNRTQILLFSFNESTCENLKELVKTHPASNNIFMALPSLISAGCCLAIFVLAAIVYLCRQEIMVFLYARFGIRLFYNNKEVRFDKEFDAFICYSYRDENFVVNELVPGLQSYRLCLHEKNFPVGGYIIESVIEAVQHSCRTILVMSPNFVKSEWCRYEFKTAHQQSLSDRCCRLIVVILENVPDEDMEAELRLYLKTNTYLRWDYPNFWDKLRFALPDLSPTITPNQLVTANS